MAAPCPTMERVLLLLMIVIGLAVDTSVGVPKPVTVNLHTRWPSSPLVLEASEYLAAESPALFWQFVDKMAEKTDFQSLSEKDQYAAILSIALPLLPPALHPLFKLSLSMRQYSPTVQMYTEMLKEIPLNKRCDAFVDVHGSIACSVTELNDLLSTAHTRPAPYLYKFDHVSEVAAQEGSTVPKVVCYGEVGTEAFHRLHVALKELAAAGRCSYVLRHAVQNVSEKKVSLSGYGVEMAIKSTEYKAQDDSKVKDEKQNDQEILDGEYGGFNFTTLSARFPELHRELGELRSHLMGESAEVTPLKVWQLQDLSYQAAQEVMSQATPQQALQSLTTISQNFPSLSGNLVKTSVKPAVRDAITANHNAFEADRVIGSAGEAALFVNGRPIDVESTDMLTVLDMLKAEAKTMEALHTMGFRSQERMMSLARMVQGSSESTKYALDTRDASVVFINDLSKEKAYKQWPRTLRAFLQPTFPGMLRHVAVNVFHVVLFVDPGQPSSLNLIRMINTYYQHSVPIRIGLVVLPEGDGDEKTNVTPSLALGRIFAHLLNEANARDAFQFLVNVADFVEETGEALSLNLVQSRLKKEHKTADFNTIIRGSETTEEYLQDAEGFFIRSGLRALPQVLMNGQPLTRSSLGEDESFEEALVSSIMEATPTFQRAIYKGELQDGMSVYDWAMARDDVVPRLSERLLAPPAAHTSAVVTAPLAAPPTGTTPSPIGDVLSTLPYLTKKDEPSVKATTVWLACDLDTPKGREVAYSAIKFLKGTAQDARVAILDNSPAESPSESSARDSRPSITQLVQSALYALSMGEAKSLVAKLLKEENVAALRDGSKTMEDLKVHGMDMSVYMRVVNDQSTAPWRAHRAFIQEATGGAIPPGTTAVLSNGAVYGPLSLDEPFSADDFALLHKLSLSSVAADARDIVRKSGITTDIRLQSDLVMKVSCLLTSGPPGPSAERKTVTIRREEHGVLHIPPNAPEAPALDVIAILDPLSKPAAKISPILKVLTEVLNVNLKIAFNCRQKLSEIPLKSYYRFVLDPEPTFNADGSARGPTAMFGNLPQKSLLTLNLQPPESWLVEAVRTPYDLDNILLEKVASRIEADFELEHLLLEGHCYDSNTGQPPRGLQFVLGTNSTPSMVDTIVMANLGYFQLKANPGAWVLQLRDGRSKEIYSIASHEHTDSPSDSPQVVVVLNNFQSRVISMKVKKNPGHTDDSVLDDGDDDDDDEEGGLWNSISSSFSGSSKPPPSTDVDKTLNIFSLASGHLYERLMRIMILSVVNNTKSPVKFWLLKNYLSPSFKDFIPHMAKEYNFEYELVQYKWPRWLNQQSEKQRVMWGYKILFLDVLFPLDVKKVIFVDADQIVRADMQELHDLDLEGAPYGYTPFCSSRKEMDGFRFWNSGYWSAHLGKRPYHISALYVIDLKRFRKVAAGDRLRGQYQGLSQDPNSLSNLDQDLPNNMIHQVKIKSLPQDWLWCETWCDDASKATAKTIDLCNNPLTKEPKLVAAQRIVPEWIGYDTRVKQLWERIYGKEETTTTTAAPSSTTVQGESTELPVHQQPREDL